MVLISWHGLKISVWKRNLGAIGYARFANLEKMKQKSTTWIKSETGKVIFVECYALWRKSDVEL